MNRDEIIKLAKECGYWSGQTLEMNDVGLERFATLVAAAEREECAKLCEEKKEYPMQIPCPDGISGCLVSHYVHARREQTGSECAAAIRTRGEK